MLKRNLNRQFGDRNGQRIAETCALHGPAMSCPACPKKPSKRGQQILEYGLLIAAVSVALTAMYMYGKRGIQAVIKGTTDSYIGSQSASEQRVTSGTPAGTNLGHSDSITTSNGGTNISRIAGGIGTNYSTTSTTVGTSQAITERLK